MYFVDYGNEADVPVADLRALPAELADLPPCAFYVCRLVFLKLLFFNLQVTIDNMPEPSDLQHIENAILQRHIIVRLGRAVVFF